ncbi:uncharacterized protein [Miscanthus floridulus]|uniref:uncharacterized protein n=1 Tax=Miscanthus floridulus TaxID=154761 RepID=UPI0034573D9D
MAAAGAALRLRLLYRMLRVGELLALVAFLSWSSSRVPSAAAAVLRFAGSLLLNARFVFVLGNAIVLLLLALSRHDLSASSSSSGQQTSTAATSTTAAAAPPQDAAPAATTASFPSSFDGTPIPPPPPATSLEAFSALPAAPAREVAAPADAATAFEFDDRPPAARVSKLARAPRRSRSEKMGPRVLQVRRAASPPAAPLELRRSESENGRRRSSVSARDAWGYCWGADDADEFRRTVEAFIDKHKRFHRQESMTMAVVAGSGSGGGGHCEAAPAFTGALAVVE